MARPSRLTTLAAVFCCGVCLAQVRQPAPNPVPPVQSAAPQQPEPQQQAEAQNEANAKPEPEPGIVERVVEAIERFLGEKPRSAKPGRVAGPLSLLREGCRAPQEWAGTYCSGSVQRPTSASNAVEIVSLARFRSTNQPQVTIRWPVVSDANDPVLVSFAIDRARRYEFKTAVEYSAGSVEVPTAPGDPGSIEVLVELVPTETTDWHGARVLLDATVEIPGNEVPEGLLIAKTSSPAGPVTVQAERQFEITTGEFVIGSPGDFRWLRLKLGDQNQQDVYVVLGNK